jgi:hypothetical protein
MNSNYKDYLRITDPYRPPAGYVAGVDSYGRLCERISLPLYKINGDGTLEKIKIPNDIKYD